jgi:diacylglycerol O-acyltransferase
LWTPGQLVEARSDTLGPEDLAILRLESPRIAGHCCKLLIAEPARGQARLTLEALREHLTGRLPRLPRMTERLSGESPNARWVPDPRFDIRNHVRGTERGRPATRGEMVDAVAHLMTSRLDRAHPLWSLHLLDLEDDRSALIVLLHHCMVDGASAVRALSEVLWDPVASVPSPPTHAPTPSVPNAPFDLRGFVRRELMPTAADTPLDRHPSAGRRVAYTRAPLTALKHVAETVAVGATVNDVLLCAVAGGLRSWLTRQGGALHRIHVKVPVSLHDAHEQSDRFGNHDSFMVVDARADEPDPSARLRAITAQTRILKARHDAQSLDRLFCELRRVSGVAAQALASWTAGPRLFTINVSNVPGPRTPVAVMGADVRELYALAEIADRHALRVAAISLADDLSIGLCADAVAVADPETIVGGVESDLTALGV